MPQKIQWESEKEQYLDLVITVNYNTNIIVLLMSTANTARGPECQRHKNCHDCMANKSSY